MNRWVPRKPPFKFFRFLCIITLVVSITVEAEEAGYRFVSVQTMLGPCCTDQGNDLIVDSDGGVLISGSRGGLDLDRDGSVDVQTFGSPDPLILKWFEENKNEKGWVQGPGGPKADAAYGVASDRQHGVYAVGNFSESMRIAGGTIFSAGKMDGFIVRYNATGKTLWAKPLGGEDADDFVDIDSDQEGNSFIIGTIRGAVDIDRDGTIDATSMGESSALLASFDPNGNLRWAKVLGGDATVSGRAIRLGEQGEIYIGGHYSKGALDLDGDGSPDSLGINSSSESSVTPQTDFNSFYAQFDSSGKMLWVKIISGPAMQIIGSMAVTGNGDLLVLGGFTGSTDLDDDGKIDMELQSMGDRKYMHHADGNAFLIRASPMGKTIWARQFFASPSHVTADKTRIVITGTYANDLDLDGDGILEREADPDERLEGFSAVLDDQGRVKHVFTIVGGDSDVANAAGFSPDGNKLYVTGYTRLGADFDNDGQIESASACHQLGDLFLVVYDVTDKKQGL